MKRWPNFKETFIIVLMECETNLILNHNLLLFILDLNMFDPI